MPEIQPATSLNWRLPHDNRWLIIEMTLPSRVTSCSHAQPAVPALGLSARAGLVPPVMRFSAAGRPSSRCPAGRHSTKRNKTCCRSILWVCPLARQKDLIISRLECLARQVLPLRGDLAAPCGGGRARAPRDPALGLRGPSGRPRDAASSWMLSWGGNHRTVQEFRILQAF